MTINVLSTNTTTQQNIGTGDTLIIEEGVVATSTNDVVYGFGTELTLLNAGLLAEDGNWAVFFSGGESTARNTYRFENLESGTIYGADYAVQLSTGFFDDDNDDSIYVYNAGRISAQQSAAVYLLFAETATVVNTGTLETEGSDVTSFYMNGLGLRSIADSTIQNSGTITSQATRIEGYNNAAVSINANPTGATSELNNSGLIQGAITAVYADIDFFSFNNSGTVIGLTYAESRDVDIINSGTMTGDVDMLAVVARGALTNTDDGHISGDILISGLGQKIFNNGGLIEGDIALTNGFITATNTGRIFGDMTITTAVDGVTFVNSADGHISGDITFVGLGEVQLDNMGLMDGDIFFGNGNDIYVSENGGLSTYGSEIHMGGGDDLAIGGEGRDRIYDGAGNDDVVGNGGNDSFRAGGGANFYDGGDGFDYLSYYNFSTRVRIDLEAESTSGGGGGNAAGNDRFINIEAIGGTNGGGDTLLGDSGRNTLYGWGGNDKLYGRSGNDKLDGGAGDDFFDGGGGTDLLIGGLGEDRFHFDRGEGDDTISDFENNIDQLEFDNFGYLTTAADALSYATQVGSDVYFDFGADGTVLVLGVTIGQLANDIEIV